MLALLELPDDLQKYWVRHLDTPTAQRAASRRLAGAEHCSSVFASSWQRLHTRRRSRQGREGASCLPTRARRYIDGNIEVFMATEPRLRRMFAERLLMIAVQETRRGPRSSAQQHGRSSRSTIDSATSATAASANSRSQAASHRRLATSHKHQASTHPWSRLGESEASLAGLGRFSAKPSSSARQTIRV